MIALLQSIPALWRDRIYGAYVLVGVVFGAIQVAIAAIPDQGQPQWLTVALVVYAYLGTAMGLTAKANVTSLSGPKPAPADPPVAGQQGHAAPSTAVALLMLALFVAGVLLLFGPLLR